MRTKTFLEFLDQKNIPYEYSKGHKIEVFSGKYLIYDSNGNSSNIFVNKDYDCKFPIENFIDKYKDYVIKDTMVVKTTRDDRLYYFYHDGEVYRDLDNNIFCSVQGFNNRLEESKQEIVNYFKKY